jgi:hypothetical protein
VTLPAFNWRRILKQWGDAILASGEVPELAGATSAGFPPATEAAIAATERRLGVRLPPSYRAFLKVSNGWWITGTAGPIRLWGVEEIGRLGDLDPELVSIWVGLGGGDGESPDDPANLPNDHLADAIKISEDNDGFYLLNPAIEPEPGEWQAAFFANWVPGAECQPSFGAMMTKLCDSFIAGHPPAKKGAKQPTLNLSKPPKEQIDDPVKFLAELRRLGFFRYATEDVAARIERDYLATFAACKQEPYKLLKGPFPSPGSALFVPDTGRVVHLEVGRLANERATYAIAMMRPLLAKAGIELEVVEELVTPDRYSARLEGITHDFLRLRNGLPTGAGSQHEGNVAMWVCNEAVKLVNKVLKQRSVPERISSQREYLGTVTIVKFRGKSLRVQDPRDAFVLLDDPMSYLVMWSGMIGNGCRPLRPDVL